TGLPAVEDRELIARPCEVGMPGAARTFGQRDHALSQWDGFRKLARLAELVDLLLKLVDLGAQRLRVVRLRLRGRGERDPPRQDCRQGEACSRDAVHPEPSQEGPAYCLLRGMSGRHGRPKSPTSA